MAPGAHGLGLEHSTLFGFHLHDIFHAHEFSRKKILRDYITFSANAALDKGGMAKQEFIKEYGPIASKHYQGLVNLFQILLNEAMVINTPLSKGAVAGFFLGIHEFPSLSSGMLYMHAPEPILRIFTDNVKERLMSDQAWESDFDPFETASFQAAYSTLDDKKIMQKFNDLVSSGKINLLERGIFSCGNTSLGAKPEEQEAFLREQVHTIGVHKSSRFIDINIALKDGQEHRLSFPTMYHKRTNAEDNFKLLKYAGKVDQEFQKLHDDVMGNASNTLSVKIYLLKVRQSLVSCLDDTKNFAKQIVSQKDANGLSLEDAYYQWAQKLPSPQSFYESSNRLNSLDGMD
jgi:hypothetical protein